MAIMNEVKKAVVGKDDMILKVLMVITLPRTSSSRTFRAWARPRWPLPFSRGVLRLQAHAVYAGRHARRRHSGSTTRLPARSTTSRAPPCATFFLADEINSHLKQDPVGPFGGYGGGARHGRRRHAETPKPYTVIATQNPIGSVGTQMPESQLTASWCGSPMVSDPAKQRGRDHQRPPAIRSA